MIILGNALKCGILCLFACSLIEIKEVSPPTLLPFGELFSVSVNIDSIVQAVVQRIGESVDKDVIPGEDIFPVMNHAMVINRNIPQEYQAYMNGE